MRLTNRYLLAMSAGCFLAACIFSCQPEQKRTWDPNDPNLPSSPLAAVMREMAETMEQAKTEHQQGKQSQLDAQLFAEIKKAAHTNANHNNLTYHAMADGFLGILDAYNQSPTQVTFNNLVDGCVSCHQNFCEGPIPRIKKMKLPEAISAL